MKCEWDWNSTDSFFFAFTLSHSKPHTGANIYFWGKCVRAKLAQVYTWMSLTIHRSSFFAKCSHFVSFVRSFILPHSNSHSHYYSHIFHSSQCFINNFWHFEHFKRYSVGFDGFIIQYTLTITFLCGLFSRFKVDQVSTRALVLWTGNMDFIAILYDDGCSHTNWYHVNWSISPIAKIVLNISHSRLDVHTSERERERCTLSQ